MYYLTLVAYYIYFNSSKVFYYLSLLIMAMFYMFVFEESVRDTQKLAAWVYKQEARGFVLFAI
jgi:ferritin